MTTRAYRAHFRERLGLLPDSLTPTTAGSIWLHAVSVGEVASAIPLIEVFRREQPSVAVFLSTATVAGRKAALKNASQIVDGIFYAPLDYASCIRRVIRRIQPALLIILETEIWPNLYAEVRRSGGQVVVVNGRISSRTWPRYLRLRRLFESILQLPNAVFTQSKADYDRFLRLGVPADHLQTVANLKYDASLSSKRSFIPTFGAEQIWIAASTVGPNERGSVTKHNVDEDELVARVFQSLAAEFPRLLLILAPRQPQRFDAVAGMLEKQGLSFVRRSSIDLDHPPHLPLPGVLLLDSIGELAGAYAMADVVFVGGSIAPRGGHNILEPAASGAPIIVGPHMENFESITADFLEARAVLQIDGAHDLLPAVRDLLRDRARANELGERARTMVERHRGISRSIAHQLWPHYFAACPKQPHSLVGRGFLRVLALLWREGGALKRRRSESRAASLTPLPLAVISVGGMTVGGSGKTPFANHLAAALKQNGYAPAILTRGYRRESPAEALIFGPGARVPSPLTGDEAQIFLRSGLAPIGIGGNRYKTAQVLLRQFPETNVLILDDGFQHAALARDFDVVLIDGLDPFGGEEVVPVGRLREPLSALSRAHVFVVTRAENDFRFDAISSRLRQENPSAPVFRTRLITRAWRDAKTGSVLPDLGCRKVGAFCAVGNPENFWRTLERLGLNVVFRWSFEDHHTYKPFELQRIAHQARVHGAEILVTTEKDWINCPRQLERAIAPLRLAWLEIDLELENEAGFLSLLESAIQTRHFAGLAS